MLQPDLRVVTAPGIKRRVPNTALILSDSADILTSEIQPDEVMNVTSRSMILGGILHVILGIKTRDVAYQ